ncbi:MAG: nucleotidyltransferase family protein, partial [Bacteroidaceae bacterium]|nr:nucleotidyltransferase family protein [Bacteroidaceae bacterium]
MSNKHGISGILFQGLTRLPKEQRPNQDLFADWITLVKKIEDRYKKQEKLADYVTKTFKKHGFRSIIIKGLSLSKYFPNPQYRHSSDIDVWLEGNKEDILSYVSSVKKPYNILYHHCDFYVIPGMDIEVHFIPSYFCNPFTNKRFKSWAKDCGQRLFPNCDTIEEGYNVPDDMFNIPYLLTHLFRHVIDEELI